MRAMRRKICLLLLTLAALMLPVFMVGAEGNGAAPAGTPDAVHTPAPTDIPGPDVRFTRDFSSRYAEYGDQVTIAYTVRNDGALPIENVVIKDSLVGEVGTVDALGPGERKTISVRVNITKNCTSSPSIVYEYDGEKHTETCGSERISLAKVDLKVELDADKTNVAPGEMVTLRLSLVNEGNVNLYGLRAEEPVLGEMGSLVSALPPGEECVVTRTVQMKSTGTFQFMISGTSDTGGAISVQSNEMSVLVTPVAAEIRLILRAEADRTQLDGPGQVTFSLYVDNECSLELRNVTLSEERKGVIRELVFVPTGEMPAITEVYDVLENGTYRFQAQVTDSVGDRLTVYSEPIEIRIIDEDAEPTPEPSGGLNTPEPQGTTIPIHGGSPYRMEENPATFEKLMFGTSIILAAVLMIWYMTEKFRRFAERRRKARRRRKQKKNKRTNAKK